MPPREVQKRIVSEFLSRCNDYADEQLARYQGELQQVSGLEALTLSDKIGHWMAYRAFNEYTLEELADGTLDDWFAED